MVMDVSDDRSDGRILSARRALISVAVGLVVGGVVGVVGAPELVPLVGWTAATTVILTWVWRISWPQDDQGTKTAGRDGEPTPYSDFAYLAFTVGMSFAVPETEPPPPLRGRSHSGTPCSPTPSAPESWRWPSTW
jgi:hypothetical protein